MNKFFMGYATGVISTPALIFAFRKPLSKHVVTPFLMQTITGEEWDQKLFEFMSTRLEFQEFRKKHGKEIHQMKAQGYSVEAIAKKFERKEVFIKAVLGQPRPN